MPTKKEPHPKTVGIIQARMGSTRLPGKVMKLLGGKEVLWHVVNRVKQCTEIDQIVVATTSLRRDDRIAEYCSTYNWKCYRGSETDVLSRYANAAVESGANDIIRVTSDCPLIDPNILTKLIHKYQTSKCDYVSTNYPQRTFPVGTDCEIMSIEALLKANAEATEQYDREHVTPYLYANTDIFNVGGLANSVDLSHIRITLDTPADLSLISDIYDEFYEKDKPLRLQDAINYVLSSKLD